MAAAAAVAWRQPARCMPTCVRTSATESSILSPHADARYTGADPAQLPRFYSPQLPPAAGRSVQLAPDEARHVARVLRLQPGDPLELCDGRGNLVQCELVQSDKTSATVCAVEAARAVPWRGPKIALAVGCLTLAGGRTDWLVEKATELGAHSLVPLVTERSNAGSGRSKFKTSGSKQQGKAAAEAETAAAAAAADYRPAGRLERLAAAAMKQAQRAHALELRPPTALSELLSAVKQAPVALVATGGAPPALQQLRTAAGQQGGADGGNGDAAAGGLQAWDGRLCWLFVGPEGDFTPGELQALMQAGALPVGLGPHRLRTETAALALLAASVAFADSAGQ